MTSDEGGGNKKKKIDIPWPQEFVFVAPSHIRLIYDQLTIDHFTLCLLEIMQAEPHQG